MKALHSGLRAAVAATMCVVFAALLAIPLPLKAQNLCPLDRQQWVHTTSVGLGGQTVLAQSFIRNVPGRVCQVKLYVAKTVFAAAGPLTLSILDVNHQVLDTADIPAAAIPFGASVQAFDFGCDGAPLAGALAFLKLESQASNPGDYRWFGAGGNLLAPGEAWRYTAAAGWNLLAGGDADFKFKVYICND